MHSATSQTGGRTADDLPHAVLGVDVGGTFTDAVVVDQFGSMFTGKTPTTPEDQSIGAIRSAEIALTAAELNATDVRSFIHGTTVTTNALLEGNFARTALLATAGFTDIEELRRQNRASLYRLCEKHPAPVVPPELRFAIRERCGPEGTITPLDEQSVADAIAELTRLEVESVAVCLLFSFRHPDHELRIREMIAAAIPGLHVSLSHRVVGTFREYERCATTTVDAALAPLLGDYLAALETRATAAGLPNPEVMLSTGGTVAAAQARSLAAQTILSGPAGGAVGVADAAARAAIPLALGFDMGGTSTDVSVSEDGRVAKTGSRIVEGRPVALPAVDIFTVGAGGGSLAWADAGGALRVGPQSAGARPGPACYGNGGSEPTVTDANLVLGYLNANAPLADGLKLDLAAAEQAVGRLGSRLDLDRLATAAGIAEIANLEMLRALTAMTVARGIDPRGSTLVAFGGAGPIHAAALASALGIDRVICPHGCGVLSAYGLAKSPRKRDLARSLVKPVDQVTDAQLNLLIEELAVMARAELGLAERLIEITTAFDLRYRGQAFELTVPVNGSRSPEDLAQKFHAAHRHHYGFSNYEAEVELVTVRVSATESESDEDVGTGITSTGLDPTAAGRDRATETIRPAFFNGSLHQTQIHSGEPRAGAEFDGPAIVELPEATVVVPPAWRATVDAAGDIELIAGVA